MITWFLTQSKAGIFLLSKTVPNELISSFSFCESLIKGVKLITFIHRMKRSLIIESVQFALFISNTIVSRLIRKLFD